MKKDNFINIPRNPKDLHSLKDLEDAYIAVNEFNNNLQNYFEAIIDSHFKTVDEVLSEIPQNKWTDYEMVDYESPRLTEYSKNQLLNNKHKKYIEDVLAELKYNENHIFRQYIYDIILCERGYYLSDGFCINIYFENMSLQEFYNNNYNDYKLEENQFNKIGFFIDHENKKIQKYFEKQNTTNKIEFEFEKNHKICMTHKAFEYNKTYYFDANSNTFIYQDNYIYL